MTENDGAYAYIRRIYGVEPKIGQRITMDGKPGVIIRPRGDPHYLRVRFDGEKHASNVHPTWKVTYADKSEFSADQSSEPGGQSE